MKKKAIRKAVAINYISQKQRFNNRQPILEVIGQRYLQIISSTKVSLTILLSKILFFSSLSFLKFKSSYEVSKYGLYNSLFLG